MDPLRLRTGDYADDLAAALAAELALPREDPFERDVVAVSTPGQGRWLMQQLGHVLGAGARGGDGVCARIDMPHPRTLFREVEREALGLDPDDDPWDPERLAWSMLRAFGLAASEPWFAEIAGHVSDEERPGRRYGAARRFGAMFSRYARWRPELLTTPGSGSDAWQHELWTLLVGVLGDATPWERAETAAERLRTDPGVSSLPQRVALWAPERLAPPERTLLAALAAGREVTVWWPGAVDPQHLLARRLAGASRAALATLTPIARTDTVASSHQPRPTLLGHLQNQVRGGARHRAVVADQSVQVHCSHGPDRQVEVLRDVLCGLFVTYPDLEPRDVVVCAPDLRTIAPLVRALCALEPETLGDGAHPVTGLRVRVTDPTGAPPNPVLDVLSRVVRLATSRAELADLLELCACAPVSYRFGLDTERLETLGELLTAAGVRWGVDSASREDFGLVGINQNTWLAGLNRLLLGVAVSEHDLAHVGSVLPLDMVESSDVALVGAAAEIVSVVRKAIASFGSAATPARWVERFRVLLDELVALPRDDAWQLSSAQLLLADLATASGPDAPEVGLGDMRRLVDSWLASRPPRSTLLTGNLTVTTLDALRHVPHRVVCLVGLDESSFPRSSRASGDDLLARAANPEDPRSSSDDRQLFLDALMAAQDTFVVVCAARDERTNDPLPLPAPVIDLLEAVAELGVDADVLAVSHPLQPYEVSDEATYDRAAVAARRALVRAPRERAERFDVRGILPAERPSAITLDQVSSFLKHPAKEFLKRRAGSWYGITGRADSDPPEEDLSSSVPVELDGLQSWALEQRLLRLAISGQPHDLIEAAELRRGELPPKQRGIDVLRRATRGVGDALVGVGPYLAVPVTHLDVGCDLPGGTRLVGRVPVRGATVVETTTSKPSDKRLIDPWLRLLLLAAGRPGDWRSVLCGRERVVTLSVPSQEAAVGILDTLVSLMLDGWDQPLPLPPRLGYALGGDPRGVDDRRRNDLWSWDTDATWRLFFTDVADLNRSAAAWGGLEKLAQDVYGPLVRAQR